MQFPLECLIWECPPELGSWRPVRGQSCSGRMKSCRVWLMVREARWSYLLDFCLVPLLWGSEARQPAFCPEGPAPSGWWVAL